MRIRTNVDASAGLFRGWRVAGDGWRVASDGWRVAGGGLKISLKNKIKIFIDIDITVCCNFKIISTFMF